MLRNREYAGIDHPVRSAPVVHPSTFLVPCMKKGIDENGGVRVG
jgi:hypothetical protein